MTALKAHGPLHLEEVLPEAAGNSSVGNTKIINIRNELIPFYNKLFYDCRQFSKGNGYKFCWYKHFKIGIRKAEGSKIYSIKSFDELYDFEKKFADIKNRLDNSNHE
jgi:hypothetical protein